MVRKFYLENEKGEQYDLMDRENKCFLYKPNGLGYTYTTEYLLLGYTFIENIRTLEKGLISGSLITRYYDNLTDFINFIEQSTKLKFVYVVPYQKKSPVTYYKDVKIASIEKSEKDEETGMLIAPITFDCISLWYEKKEMIYDVETKEDEIRWDFEWDSRFRSYNNKNIVLNNDGHVEAPIQVEFYGYVENPCIRVLVDNEEKYKLKIPIVIQPYEKLLYSSMDNDIYIYKQNTDETLENLFKNEYIDISKNNIFKIPKGISTIRLTSDNDILKAKFTVTQLYKAV